MPNLPEAYLPALLAGDRAALLSGFAGDPLIADPLDGRIVGTAALEQFVRAKHAWLVERAATLEPIRVTATAPRTVVEALLHLQHNGQPTELPIAVVGANAGEGQVTALRVYHSRWPLEGRHAVRPPLLTVDHRQHVTDIVKTYQAALAAGDLDAIVATFEPDGYFREPAGGEWIYRGHARLREFMAHLLASGGIGLEHCTVTDDGEACALEFNAVSFGTQPLTPQAGVAVYERGPSGLLHAARIYDDVNVEALAG
jgi:hypothetical protein